MTTVWQKRWEHFPHDADIGVRGIGPSREEAFEQAALALTAVVVDPQALSAPDVVEITPEAGDDRLLPVDRPNRIRSPSMRGVAEEAPAAYKDVSAVVDAADHAKLSRTVARLKPIVCIKG